MVMLDTTWTDSDEKNLCETLSKEYPFSCNIKVRDYQSSEWITVKKCFNVIVGALISIILVSPGLFLGTVMLNITAALILLAIMVAFGFFMPLIFECGDSKKKLEYSSGTLRRSYHPVICIGNNTNYKLSSIISRLDAEKKRLDKLEHSKSGIRYKNKSAAKRFLNSKTQPDVDMSDFESEIEKRVEAELRRRAEEEVEQLISKVDAAEEKYNKRSTDKNIKALARRTKVQSL